MKQLAAVATLLMCLQVGGCGDDPAGTVSQPLPTESIPGIYAGEFPCDGCAGIPSRLWIRSDGRFFFEQQYPSDEEGGGMSVYSFGRWEIGDDPHLVFLDSSGPRRTFARADEDSLLLQTPSELEYRLTRERTPRAFAATVHMTGMVRPDDGGMEFTECLTRYVVPVGRGGDVARLWHQYRSLGGPRGAVYVEFEGRFSWSGDGAPSGVTIDRFVTIKAGASCS